MFQLFLEPGPADVTRQSPLLQPGKHISGKEEHIWALRAQLLSDGSCVLVLAGVGLIFPPGVAVGPCLGFAGRAGSTAWGLFC